MVRMSFLGLFPFTAPFLPWVLFSFSVMLGNSATIDLLGIAVGHIYFYLDEILPRIAERFEDGESRSLFRHPVSCGTCFHNETKTFFVYEADT